MSKVAILIDGGNSRVLAREAGKDYNPAYIASIANSCLQSGESLLRILYYDCAPYNGTAKLPVSGAEKTFSASDGWLHELGRKDYFAIRLGVLKFRGFRPKHVPMSPQQFSDNDFKPIFEQKGVDMRIGLDIAQFSENRAVDRIKLCTQDTDCIPAMKYARRAGLQLVLIRFPNSHIAPELLEYTDFDRPVGWP